jgi:hypothetical protein
MVENKYRNTNVEEVLSAYEFVALKEDSRRPATSVILSYTLWQPTHLAPV